MSKAVFAQFHPREYLKEYYSKVGLENSSLLEFFAKVYKEDVVSDSTMLEFGGGPTVYPLISAAPKVGAIHFSDYLEENLKEVRLWKNRGKKAFNWDTFLKKVLALEGIKKISHTDIKERENLMRRKIKKITHCDAFNKDPMGKEYRNYYDVINTNFVTESITSSKKTWEKLVSNICSMLKKDGVLVMTAIKGAKYYRIGDKRFPAVPVTEDDLIRVLTRLGFQETSFVLYSVPAEVMDEELKGYTGYNGFIFLKAKK